ncbi:GatB/YqeY domain-containing protein [Nostocoides australiense]|uniref:GatB/YqeY domain-containing protein n=1 Tax=Nostocoides australiense Ben110 TaxID=1193182 RepID=W6JTZ2_9MICO|nr:GatB/YqeY domain-containing protein [Tetrasphaera australiensis]MCA0293177.1 GatB/YqeY domain-containing protein [Actinomycetota bacterium]MCB1300319.1 GatB/YqeY domain-containing protein [Tetrasphaera sp.]CCH72833.1 conserved hypothetical protein [Tetrasphaera australiensis Ben110]HPF79736.1 GatB/YqeY domain-containing protein [Tetrasphaera australiensis]HRW00692.1 GatB/YqeY domain-containing protein [Tetrasphaera sp.]
MTVSKASLQSDLTDAMRAQDKVRAGTLRMALTAITMEESAGAHHELSDDEVLKVLAKEAKKRREAATAYTDAGRPELAEVENAELAILQAYLPEQLDEAAVAGIIEEVIAETGATGMAQMGPVMKAVQAKVAGRADGKAVAAAVRAALAKS